MGENMITFEFENGTILPLKTLGDALEYAATNHTRMAEEEKCFISLSQAIVLHKEYEAAKLSNDKLMDEAKQLLAKLNLLEEQFEQESRRADSATSMLDSEERKFWMACCEAVTASINCIDKESPSQWADRQLEEYCKRFKV